MLGRTANGRAAVNLALESRTVRAGAGDLRTVRMSDPRDGVVNGGEIRPAAKSAAVLERVPS
jgi:hypothetical protein